MKYVKIYNDYWDQDTSAGRKTVLSKLTPAELKAWEVLDFLYGRGGFDHWWDAIDHETHDEIFAGLVKALS